jgi:hypothetical protein
MECLLLEVDTKEPLHLIKPLFGLRVWHVGDVFQEASGGRHVVRHAGEVEATRSPHAGIILVITERVRWLLLRKVLPFELELILDSL